MTDKTYLSLPVTDLLNYLKLVENGKQTPFEAFISILDENFFHEMKKLLTNGTLNRNGFRAERTWKTNHLQHMLVFLFIIFCEFINQSIKAIDKKHEDIPRLEQLAELLKNEGGKVKDVVDSVKEVSGSALTEESKSVVKDMGIKQTLSALEDIAPHIDDVINIKERHNELDGELKERLIECIWIECYLANELGSEREAFEYISDVNNPYLRNVSYYAIQKAYGRYKTKVRTT